MKRTFKHILLSSLCVVGSMAHAVPIDLDISAAESSVEVGGSPLCAPLSVCGGVGTLAADLDSQMNSLDTGDSWTFDFFNVEFFGFGFGFSTINATLGFDLPPDISGVSSFGIGGNIVIGPVTGVVLQWDPIAPIPLTDGRQLLVEFENFTGDVFEGPVTVHSTISLVEGTPPSEVPEPSSLALLGLGAVALSFARRKSSPAQ